jgi:hypothetical protein
MSKHSTLIGGSTADRLLNCPGSFQLIQRIPDVPEVPSEYANYGSAMHAVMDKLVTQYSAGFPSDRMRMLEAADELVGEHFYDRELLLEHLADSIYPAIDTLYDLMREYGAASRFSVVANELRVKFPGVPGAHGTADLIIANDKYIVLVDWKFGMGIPVKAVYPDALGDRVNPQLMFYLAGAISELPGPFDNSKRYVVAVVQPRVEERLTHTVVTRTEVNMFIEDVDNAVAFAVSKNPPLAAGDHCRWCPARPQCPLHTGPLFQLSELQDVVPAMPVPADSDDGSYGEFLAKAKRLADMAADYKKQVDEAVHGYLEAGGTVPGWRLKLKTKLRQWIDEDVVNNELTRLGFSQDDIWQRKLQTFAIADKAAKRLGKKIPDHLRVAPETNETTLATTDDPAPVVDRKGAADELMHALKRLRHGS